MKDKVIIKAATPDLDDNFKLCLKCKKEIPVNSEVELDAMNSCNSSDNRSFISLCIGVDPFALNNRHYQNIISTSTSEKSAIKQRKKSQEKKGLNL